MDAPVEITPNCISSACRLYTSWDVDWRSLVRGALLHDYFLYNWREHNGDHKLHGFYHARKAMENAERDFGLNPIEANIIHRHMFPLNPTPPKYRESVVVTCADKILSLIHS